ncbi:MAG TPA: hypothetical protein VEY31_02445, partial [Roseococcus sp.]|nr:hypothetical protein [Roseococcus sp.]
MSVTPEHLGNASASSALILRPSASDGTIAERYCNTTSTRSSNRLASEPQDVFLNSALVSTKPRLG